MSHERSSDPQEKASSGTAPEDAAVKHRPRPGGGSGGPVPSLNLEQKWPRRHISRKRKPAPGGAGSQDDGGSDET